MDARPIQTEYRFPTAYSGWGFEERDAIDRVMRSEKFTMGPECEALEHEFADYHKMKHAIAVNSGSSANLISVAALVEHKYLSPGQTVTVPALAWATTYAPLIQYGLNLLLADVGPDWNATCCPIDCSILGAPTGSPNIISTGSFLEDNCESIGARDVNGRLTGTRGLLNTFSFYYSHQLSAVEGGMILTNDADLARSCRLLRSHGWTRGIRRSESLEDEFEFVSFGYNVRPLELHAAIAREQLKKLNTRIRARLANLAYWRRESEGLPLIHPEFHGRPSPFGIHFQVESREVRQKLANALRANGIDCRPPVAGSFRLQPYGKRWSDQQTPNADKIHWTGLMLGLPPFDGTELIDSAVKVMKETL